MSFLAQRTRTAPRGTTTGAVGASLAVTVAGLAAIGTVGLTATAASGAVTIDAPSNPRAGTVQLTGTVRPDPGGTTTVLYVVDATSSTGQVGGLDCSGSGGAGGPEDDLNGDGSLGDVLDCEIAGVQALNRSLVATSGVQAGLVAFANQAAAASFDTAGTTTFVAPGFTGGDPSTRVDAVAGSVRRSRIGLYVPKELGASGSGSAFSGAVTTALATLASAPAGPKWIMFLSDGQSGIDNYLLDDLATSGVRLRTFGIGTSATCDRSGSLFKMAAATGESCAVSADPSQLAAQLTGSRPDSVSGVTVTIGSTAVAGSVDAVGGWKAGFVLGAGTYTAQVRATLTSGAVQTTQRTFTVAPGDASVTPGTVGVAPGALRATAVKVRRPAPTRDVLPARVTGLVGRPVDGVSASEALTGARVELQARAGAGTAWVTVATSSARSNGSFRLAWKPRAKWQVLRVALRPTAGFAESFGAVAQAPISACKVKGKKSWTVTCRTTAKSRSAVRLLDGSTVVDRSRVKRGTLTLHGTGPVKGSRIEVVRGSRKIRLTL